MADLTAEHLFAGLSLLVTVGGFIAAIWQVRKAKTAAESAEAAANATRHDVQKAAVIDRLSRVIALLEESRRFVRRGQWEDASDRFSDATRLLNESKSSRSIMGQTDRSYLQSSITDLRGLMDQMEGWIAVPSATPRRDSATVNRRLNGIIHDIQTVHSSARLS